MVSLHPRHIRCSYLYCSGNSISSIQGASLTKSGALTVRHYDRTRVISLDAAVTQTLVYLLNGIHCNVYQNYYHPVRSTV